MRNSPNLYAVGKAILSHYTTFKSKTMIQKLSEVMKPGEKLAIGLTFKEGEVIMTIQPFNLESKKSFSPFAASGSAESLEELAIPAFIEKLNELNPTVVHIEATAMEESAKETKKAEPKKPEVKAAPAKKEKPPKPEKVEKPKPTAAQKKSMERIEKMAQRVSDFKTFDQDMYDYLKKEADKEATSAGLDADVVNHLFEEAKDKVIDRTNSENERTEETDKSLKQHVEETKAHVAEIKEELNKDEDTSFNVDELEDDLPFKPEEDSPEIIIEQQEITVPEKDPAVDSPKPTAPTVVESNDDEDIY